MKPPSSEKPSKAGRRGPPGPPSGPPKGSRGRHMLLPKDQPRTSAAVNEVRRKLMAAKAQAESKRSEHLKTTTLEEKQPSRAHSSKPELPKRRISRQMRSFSQDDKESKQREPETDKKGKTASNGDQGREEISSCEQQKLECESLTYQEGKFSRRGELLKETKTQSPEIPECPSEQMNEYNRAERRNADLSGEEDECKEATGEHLEDSETEIGNPVSPTRETDRHPRDIHRIDKLMSNSGDILLNEDTSEIESASDSEEASDENSDSESQSLPRKLLPGSQATLEEKFADWQLISVPKVLCSDETIKILHDLVTSPVPPGEVLKCQLEKVSNVSSSKDYFTLCLPIQNKFHSGEKRVAVMTAQRCNNAFGQTKYVFSLDHEDFYKHGNERSKWYFGKLVGVPGSNSFIRSNCMQYTLYDNGLSREKLKKAQESLESNLEKKETGTAGKFSKKLRKQVLSVLYTSDSNMPKSLQMSAAIPLENETHSAQLTLDHKKSLEFILNYNAVNSNTDFIQRTESSMEMKRLQLFRSLHSHGQKHLGIGSLIRYPVAPSIKNYELVDVIRDGSQSEKQEKNSESLKASTGMARIGTRRFFIAVQHPLNVYQAFAIAISRFDSTKSLGARVTRNFH